MYININGLNHCNSYLLMVFLLFSLPSVAESLAPGPKFEHPVCYQRLSAVFCHSYNVVSSVLMWCLSGVFPAWISMCFDWK